MGGGNGGKRLRVRASRAAYPTREMLTCLDTLLPVLRKPCSLLISVGATSLWRRVSGLQETTSHSLQGAGLGYKLSGLPFLSSSISPPVGSYTEFFGDPFSLGTRPGNPRSFPSLGTMKE